MCMFSAEVEHVGRTRIFATPAGAGTQALAYEMAFAARGELAMVLPIPVPVGSPDDAVAFVDLSAWPRFFGWLEVAFPSFAPQPASRQALAVHDVGAFQASFVPRAADFDRLDARFRLSKDVLAALPSYGDYGFVVVKLKGRSMLDRMRGERETPMHPIAFTFPSRAPDRLFFPTVHVHDGAVHATADFDHVLYGQTTGDVPDAERGALTLAQAVPHRQDVPLIDPHLPVWRRTMRGQFANEDVWWGR